MRNRILGVAPLAMLAMACGDSTGITPDKLAGTWIATEFVLTNPTNAAQTVDLIALGGSMTIVVRADSTFTSTVQEPGGIPDVDTGTISVTGTVLTIAESGSGSPTSYTAVRDGDVLTLTSTDEEYDFDGDGTDEAATLRIVLRRN